MKELLKEYNILEEKLKLLKTDEEKLKFCKNNVKDVLLYLDNDSTTIFYDKRFEVLYDEIDNFEPNFFYLDDYIGWHEGIENLLKFCGIRYEIC